MKTFAYQLPVSIFFWVSVVSCSTANSSVDQNVKFTPSAVVDFGALVTEDLPEHFWGKSFLKQMNFTKQNSFDVIRWNFPMEGGSVSGSNAYYTLFNHGGPHVDAPNHMGEGGGIDSYSIEGFSGPVKVFDVGSYAFGRSVPASIFQGHVQPGDIVLILTRYTPPETDEALPDVRTLSNEAAEFLATLHVRAYGTDAFSVDALTDNRLPSIHHAFLSRGIPVYEQLLNVDKLLGKEKLFFVGVPLNIKDGDEMTVRPVVFVY